MSASRTSSGTDSFRKSDALTAPASARMASTRRSFRRKSCTASAGSIPSMMAAWLNGGRPLITGTSGAVHGGQHHRWSCSFAEDNASAGRHDGVVGLPRFARSPDERFLRPLRVDVFGLGTRFVDLLLDLVKTLLHLFDPLAYIAHVTGIPVRGSTAHPGPGTDPFTRSDVA